MNKCEKCGFLHYRTDPCRVATKSTGAKARASTNHRGSQVAQAVEQGDASVIAQGPSCASSTLALPVDASSTKFDKVAYQRAYMAKYRRGEVGNKYRQSLPKQYD